MNYDDEFNQLVMNELIGPCSSDDENDLFFWCSAHDHWGFGSSSLITHPGRIGSVEGPGVLDRERLFWLGLCKMCLFVCTQHR